jgi:hypothetical protein
MSALLFVIDGEEANLKTPCGWLLLERGQNKLVSDTYCSLPPDSLHPRKREFSADILSLGFVYLEMLATVRSQPQP